MAEGNTEHTDLRSIAEQLTGTTMPGKSSSHYLDLIERNIGKQTQEQTDSDTTIEDSNVDTVGVDTSNNPVTITLPAEAFESGDEITIVDIGDVAATNSITIQPSGGAGMLPENPTTIGVSGGAVTFEYQAGGLLSSLGQFQATAVVGGIFGGL